MGKENKESHMKLLKFTDITEYQYEDYMGEWESLNENIVPSATKRRGDTFQELQDVWNSDERAIMFQKGLVPSSLFFYTDDEGMIVGAIHLRHELNDRLLQNGGHIGYGIRPSARRKGYASQMLSELLAKIWQEGYEKVLITCDDSNLASAKTIERQGGILTDKPIFEGILTRRYWISRNKE
jgi:predicted acetyltransferase